MVLAAIMILCTAVSRAADPSHARLQAITHPHHHSSPTTHHQPPLITRRKSPPITHHSSPPSRITHHPSLIPHH
eukprot:13512-Rhodomonas_salina.1